MSRKRLFRSAIALLSVLAIAQTGCTLIQSSHINGEAAGPPSCSAETRGSASATYRFQRNGSEKPNVATGTASDFRAALDGSGVFSNVDYVGRSDTHLELVANNKGNIAGAVGIGFLSGLTFGLIGTKVSDYYDITITLTTPGRTPQTLSFERETVSRSGLIKPGAGEGFRDVANGSAAYRSHIRETVNAALSQWVGAGLLCESPSRAQIEAPHLMRAASRPRSPSRVDGGNAWVDLARGVAERPLL